MEDGASCTVGKDSIWRLNVACPALSVLDTTWTSMVNAFSQWSAGECDYFKFTEVNPDAGMSSIPVKPAPMLSKAESQDEYRKKSGRKEGAKSHECKVSALACRGAGFNLYR